MRAKTAVLVGAGVGAPIAIAIVVAALLLRHNPSPIRATANAAPLAAASVSAASSPDSDPTSAVPATTPSSPSPSKRPLGSLAITNWSDIWSDNKCVDVRVWYDNRSDTAVDVITQSFLTNYTPKHRPGTYPDLVDGPTKTLSQQVGIQAFTKKIIEWNVCAPELVALQNPPPPDGTDSFQEEIGAKPTYFHWTWF
jgi:hypothetical protein